jgi:hypothetical protein
MKPSTALGIILGLVSNSQRLRTITTQTRVCATLTINLGKAFPLTTAENVSIVSWSNGTYEATLNKIRKTREISGEINRVLRNQNVFYQNERQRTDVLLSA